MCAENVISCLTDGGGGHKAAQMPARVCGQARLVKHFEMHVCTYSVCNVGVSPYGAIQLKGFFSVHLADG